MIDEVQGVIQNRSLTKKDKIRKALNRYYFDAWSAYDWEQLETHEELGLRKFDDTLADIETGEYYFPMPFNAELIKKVWRYSPDAGPIEKKSMGVRDFCVLGVACLFSEIANQPVLQTRNCPAC